MDHRHARDLVAGVAVDGEVIALQRVPDIGAPDQACPNLRRGRAAKDPPIRADDFDAQISRTSVPQSRQRRRARRALLREDRRQTHDTREELARGGDGMSHLIVELIGHAQGYVTGLDRALAPERDLVGHLDHDGGQDRQCDDQQKALEQAHSSPRDDVRGAIAAPGLSTSDTLGCFRGPPALKRCNAGRRVPADPCDGETG